MPKDQWDWRTRMLIKSAILSAVGESFDDSIDIEHDIQPFCENPYYVW